MPKMGKNGGGLSGPIVWLEKEGEAMKGKRLGLRVGGKRGKGDWS